MNGPTCKRDLWGAYAVKLIKVRGGFSETIEDFLRRIGLIKEKIEISERIVEIPLIFYLMHRNVKKI